MWTQFWDMNSGGGQKEDWPRIYIEAGKDEAKRVFYARFGHNPERVTCTCCGQDYNISSEESLDQLTAYHRNCAYAYFRPDGTECPEREAWKPGKGITPGYAGRYVERARESSYSTYQHVTLADYMASPEVHFIHASDIKLEWRTASVPEQGYVWAD